jgi:hypothetical protein
MECGFENLKEVINTILIGIGTIAILFAAISYRLNLKQHYFSVINNSINKFQNLFITEEKFTIKEKLKYLDLVNEQLFYIENYYVPSDIATEWIDGMIDFLPLFDNGFDKIQPNPRSKFGDSYKDLNILLFPRILNAFTLNTKLELCDLTNPDNYKKRQMVVINIFKNIKRNSFLIRKHCALRKAKRFMRITYKNQSHWKGNYSKILQ